jgi:hypothetical protein
MLGYQDQKEQEDNILPGKTSYSKAYYTKKVNLQKIQFDIIQTIYE